MPCKAVFFQRHFTSNFINIFFLLGLCTTADGRTENVDLVIVATLRMAMMSCGSCRLEKRVARFVVLSNVKEKAPLTVQEVEAR